MSKVSELVAELADKPRGTTKVGVRMLISLNHVDNERLILLARALDVPTGVLASRLLQAAIQDAEQRASDLDLYEGEYHGPG